MTREKSRPAKGYRVRLIHWKAGEAPERLDILESAGHRPEFDDLAGGAASWKKVREDPPEAFVIDLGRLPSHGREAGAYIRNTKALRTLPIVFVDGEPEKVARVRKEFPDAVYTDWEGIGPAVRKAIEEAPEEFKRPMEHMERYAGRPLARKLGIKPGSVLVLVAPPDDHEQILSDLPRDVQVRTRNQGARDLTIWFTRSLKDLESGVERVARRIGETSVWIAWAKKSSPLAADHNELDVRRVGLDAGLVDYKICSISDDWSGLLFKRRSR